MREVIMLTLEQDVVSNYAKKKHARRRMDFLDVNTKSYAKWLNLLEWMEKYTYQNALVGLLSKMKLEKEEEKKKQKEKKAEYKKQKTKKKARNKENAKRKILQKEIEKPIAAAHVDKGLDHVLKLTNSKLQKNIVSLLWREQNGHEETAPTQFEISHKRKNESFVMIRPNSTRPKPQPN